MAYSVRPRNDSGDLSGLIRSPLHLHRSQPSNSEKLYAMTQCSADGPIREARGSEEPMRPNTGGSAGAGGSKAGEMPETIIAKAKPMKVEALMSRFVHHELTGYGKRKPASASIPPPAAEPLLSLQWGWRRRHGGTRKRLATADDEEQR